MTEQKDRKVKKVRRVKVKKKSNKNIILAVMLLLVVVVFTGVFIYGHYMEQQREAELARIAEQEKEMLLYGDEAIGIDQKVDHKLKDFRNILFLGVDTDDYNDGDNRTDAIVIVSINEKTNDVKLFSVQRDTFMEIEPDRFEKITHAYWYGGMDETLWALNRNMDLNIRDVMVFSWTAVENVVDRVGGVTVELSDRELEFLNTMVGPDNQVPGSGEQLLNGEQAVMYSRMRKDMEKDSDYRRNQRFKVVVTDALKKAQQLETEDAIIFAENTLDDVITNIRSDEIVEMAKNAGNYNIVKSDESYPFFRKGWKSDETGRVFVPVSLEENLADMYNRYFGMDDYQMSETAKEISDKLVEKTGLQ